MKKKMGRVLGALVTVLFVGSLALPAKAQTQFRALTHDEGLAAAKKEGKLLFVDFYTTWCPPCKMMSQKVFPQKEVGDFMNKHFVNIKLDVEKDTEGAPYATKYQISAVPTFVILNPKTGKVVYRLSGAIFDGAEWIKTLTEALPK